MKSLNLKSFAAALFIAAASLTSCKKESVAPPPAPSPVVGTWVGKYGYGNNVPSNYYSFVINQDGTVVVKADKENPDVLGSGTWSLNGNTFKIVYYYNDPTKKLNAVATVNIEKKEMTGNWGYGEVSQDSGTFIMNK